MGERVVLVVSVALATLRVLQAMGLEKTPFPDYLDEKPDSPASWAASTHWLGTLRSSYSQILRYETDETLARTMSFAANIETATRKYKDQVEGILADADKPNYLRCTRDNKLKKIQEVIATEDRHLIKCATPLQTLHVEYKATLENLTAELEARSEDTIYTPCLPTYSTVALADGAGKCFYASVQAALTGFYYPVGAAILRTVTEFRSSIAQARDEASACAAASTLTPAQSIMQDLEATTSCLHPTRQRVRRGFGKKFKKFLKKAKNGIKKVCSKVPCKIGYTVPFG